MPIVKITLPFVTLVCSLAVASFAQTSGGGIFVMVKDQAGGTISGAGIKLSRSGEREKQVKTNSLGTGQFLKLPAGDYRIMVSASGFKDETRDLTISSDETQRIEITLAIAPIETSVEIGDADAENTGATTVISEAQIAGLPDNQEELNAPLKGWARL